MDEQDENMGPELLEKLSEDWKEMIQSQPQTLTFIQQSVKRSISSDGRLAYPFVAFFNQKLDINRFFIEDSDGKKSNTETQDFNNDEIMGGKGTGQIGFEDNSDPFENELEEALCVFKSGDGNTDIIEQN